MPIWLRNYTLKTILQNLQAESENAQKLSDEQNNVQRLDMNNPKKVQMPDIVQKASYTTTVAKKQ